MNQIIKYLLKLLQQYLPDIIGIFVKTIKKIEPQKITIKKEKTAYEKMRDLIIKQGGNFVPGKPFMFGIRNDSNTNRFNDVIGILYTENEVNKVFICKGTTDPGLYWVKHPIAGKPGAAMISFGIHNNLWIRGKRSSLGGRKNVEILRQNGSKVRISRDIDKDGHIDENEPIIYGPNEIQFHPMGFSDREIGRIVGKWSAGCQGAMKISDFHKIMGILTKFDIENPRKGNIKFNRWSYGVFDYKNTRIPLRIRKKAV